MRSLIPIGVLLCVGGALLLSCAVLGTSDKTEQLVGPTWQLTSLRTSDGDQYSPDQLVGRDGSDETYVLQFSEDGKLGGTADCNTYGGQYVAGDGGGLSVDALVSTEIFCGEDSRESLYLEGLGEADGYEVSGGYLRIGYGKRGVLEFVRE